MELRQLRYFLAAAELDHVSRAADRSHVSQSTLSHGIRQLEDELGVALFDRIGRGVRLTKAGRTFSAHAARALRELDGGVAALKSLQSLEGGLLEIGVIPTFLTTLVPQAVADFSRDHPKVAVRILELRAGEVEEELAAGRLDLGVAFHPAQKAELDAEPLFEERLDLAVAHGHELSGRRRIGAAELQGRAIALLSKRFATRRLIDSALARHGVAPRVAVEMESVDALLETVSRQGLPTIAPDRAIASTSGVHGIRIGLPGFVRPAGLLWRRDASRLAPAVEFARRLRLLCRVPGGRGGPGT